MRRLQHAQLLEQGALIRIHPFVGYLAVFHVGYRAGGKENLFAGGCNAHLGSSTGVGAGLRGRRLAGSLWAEVGQGVGHFRGVETEKRSDNTSRFVPSTLYM